jgi:hypothetical protein
MELSSPCHEKKYWCYTATSLKVGSMYICLNFGLLQNTTNLFGHHFSSWHRINYQFVEKRETCLAKVFCLGVKKRNADFSLSFFFIRNSQRSSEFHYATTNVPPTKTPIREKERRK